MPKRVQMLVAGVAIYNCTPSQQCIIHFYLFRLENILICTQREEGTVTLFRRAGAIVVTERNVYIYSNTQFCYGYVLLQHLGPDQYFSGSG